MNEYSQTKFRARNGTSCIDLKSFAKRESLGTPDGTQENIQIVSVAE